MLMMCSKPFASAMRYSLVLTLLATPAAAEQSRVVWPSVTGVTDASFIEMHEPTHPDAHATITFHNEQVHEGREDFALTYDGLTAQIVLGFNVEPGGAERITVIPPDGYLAVPAEITVPEHQHDEVQIVPWLGG